MKLTKKQREEMIKNHKERLEENAKMYEEERYVYESTIEHLIFELEMIEDWWDYSVDEMIEWLKWKVNDLEWFDTVLSMLWK